MCYLNKKQQKVILNKNLIFNKIKIIKLIKYLKNIIAIFRIIKTQMILIDLQITLFFQTYLNPQNLKILQLMNTFNKNINQIKVKFKIMI